MFPRSIAVILAAAAPCSTTSIDPLLLHAAFNKESKIPSVIANPAFYFEAGLGKTASFNMASEIPTGQINVEGEFQYLSAWNFHDKRVIVGKIYKDNHFLPLIISFEKAQIQDGTYDRIRSALRQQASPDEKSNLTHTILHCKSDLLDIPKYLMPYIAKQLRQALEKPGNNFLLATTPNLIETDLQPADLQVNAQ